MSLDNEIVKIASMYFEEGLTQAEIAQQRGVSRSLISKYLNDAKKAGIVKVFIDADTVYTTRLERELEKKFNLTNALVVDTYGLEQAEINRLVSQKASQFLLEIIANYQSVGISWGRSLRRLVDMMPHSRSSQTTIIPLIGGLSDEYFDIQSNQLSYDLARKIRGKAKYLYAPAIVANQALKAELTSNSAIQSILEDGKQVTLALVGISSLDQEDNMKRIGYTDQDDIQRLGDKGAVGVINSRFFDQQGRELDDDINHRVIGLDLEDLRQINQVMTVVQGDKKAEAVKIALDAQLISMIVTTDTLAEQILNLTKD
ncbi:transcriptional regulator [Aerococcus urinaehominis]|uniref:Transcriptional regulator n=1 Tax=Aerococcus urinaehominis TaxID=128944 RepID=A0A109RGQ6_9LACT|nr:sugar-binding transcriptional regulator [Aerococcus urinaehominis]AMB99323.1 transcriptional regulator [Aerococcus urinaehominis]SDM20368.1 DNA-binding transcriptional regulator LsrR, DeoR family [Aerococcus urinaehominis]